jgi:hypothetical protein
MARLRTDKVRQLSGLGALAGYLLVVIQLAGDNTDEGLFGYVLGGGIVAFFIGFYAGPPLIAWARHRIKDRPRSARRDRTPRR